VETSLLLKEKLQFCITSLKVLMLGWPNLRCHKYELLGAKLALLETKLALLQLETVLTEGKETGKEENLAELREISGNSYKSSRPTWPLRRTASVS
jgi:hypothetical protein